MQPFPVKNCMPAGDLFKATQLFNDWWDQDCQSLFSGNLPPPFLSNSFFFLHHAEIIEEYDCFQEFELYI